MSLVDFDSLGLPAAIREALQELAQSIFFGAYSSKGANGYTFFGTNLVLHRRVAVKFYYCGEGSRFHAEPMALAAVRSPNIIEVLDARVIGDEWAVFQTPLCDNGDLDTYLAAAGPLSLREALDMGLGLLGGVAALHAHNMLHRDLKPENLLITDEKVLVIGDFGSVRRLKDGQHAVPGSGHSVLYRPPEAFGTGGYSTCGDLYQCGITLYQLLGGELPYDEEEWLDREARRCLEAASDAADRSACVAAAIRRKVERGRVLEMDSLPPFVPEAARGAVRKATRTDPARRFSSCAEFMAKISEVRVRSLDWRAEGEGWVAAAPGRSVRVVPGRSGYYAEQHKGRGWRRIGAVGTGDPREVIKRVEDRFRS